MIFQRIRDLREDKDWTQKELGERLGISQTGYSKYETGENNIPVGVLIELANIHHTSVDYLLGLTNRKEPYPSPK